MQNRLQKRSQRVFKECSFEKYSNQCLTRIGNRIQRVFNIVLERVRKEYSARVRYYKTEPVECSERKWKRNGGLCALF